MTNDELLADCHTLAKLRFGEGYSINENRDEGGIYWILYKYDFKNGYITKQTRLHKTYSLRNLRTHIKLNYYY